jgi:high-affinity iron transporter
MQATIGATFLIVFRETLEAGLIIGAILTVLSRLNAKQYFVHIFASTALAILASIAAAWGIELLTSSVQGQYLKIVEGAVSLLACGVLTYMILWMAEQSRRIKSEIESKLTEAVSGKDLFVMISLPFISVFREGVETVLFLKAISLQTSEAVSWVGGIFGFGLSVLVITLMFIGGKRISLKPLFKATSFLLFFIAAGLLAYGVHELEEAGWLNGIISPVWNMNHILNEKEGFGALMKALFGYNGNPSLLEVMVYISYFLSMILLNRFRDKEVEKSYLRV